MSENRHNDPIDDFFRQQLNSEKAHTASDWNTPAEEVWEQLEASSSRRRLLYLPLLAAAILLLLIGVWQLYHYLQSQAAVIQELQAQVEELQRERSAEQNKNNESLVIEKKSVEQFSADVIEATTSVEDKIVSSISTTRSSIFTDSSNDSSILNTQEKSQSTAASTKPELSAPKSKSPAIVQSNIDISALPTAAIPTLQTSAPDLTVSTVLLPTSPNRGWSSISLLYTPFSSSTQLPPRHRRLFQQRTVSTSNLQIGTQVNYTISEQWFIETGISYAREQIQQEYTRRPRFLRRNERRNNNNRLESSYDFALYSPQGLVEAEVVLTRSMDSATPADNSDLEVTVLSSTSMQSLQIPLLLGYQYRKDRFRFDLKGGILFQYQWQPQFEIDAVTVGNTAFEARHERRPRLRRSDTYGQLDWSLYLSPTISYQFTSNLAIQVEPYVQQALQPKTLRPSPMLQRDIFEQAVGLRLGLRYIL
ncbi:MAG: outer membrane beta-barrel protein [Bacteroidota bacterium]